MRKQKRKKEKGEHEPFRGRLHPDTRKSAWAVVLIGLALIMVLASTRRAGPAGEILYGTLNAAFGWGYFLVPIALIAVAGIFLLRRRASVIGVTAAGAALAVLSALGLLDIFAPGRAGYAGLLVGSLDAPFGRTAAVVIATSALAVGLIVAMNTPITLFAPKKEEKEPFEKKAREAPDAAPEEEETPEPNEEESAPVVATESSTETTQRKKAPPRSFKNYVPPPLSLLKTAEEKPTTGDLRANANIIKRTLESFGITVEMGEVNIGPKVTRYTLKPAEGTKLSKITALHQDLALALAAHPIRIEAPIPGKSFIGIEVPNKAAALVRLGNLLQYQEFSQAGPLAFSLGRDVTGEPIFADVSRMPHLLVAGATGSGKSVAIHSLILSLLFKNSPDTLRLVLIDPKRVELSIYEHIPHLVSPVVTESKKALGVFRWAIKEMERRYGILLASGSRDVKSYNARNQSASLPYLLVVIDELADLMTSFGREVEGSVIRLAQMARATGIHLVLSTQRPSVEVITGLIKANITNRIALQVASQIDSRTILDSGGAEKLLGGGDLLFLSPELSKPKRIQGAYVSEDEVRSVVSFIKEHNRAVPDAQEEEAVTFENNSEHAGVGEFEEVPGEESGEDDELYREAIAVVRQAQKASASLLQRRLKVGYARAARLLDLMEEHNVIGPGDGAKPREVFIARDEA